MEEFGKKVDSLVDDVEEVIDDVEEVIDQEPAKQK